LLTSEDIKEIIRKRIAKQEKKISTKTRYFSPDISHDGKTIAVAEIKDNLKSNIVIIHEDGAIAKKFTNNKRMRANKLQIPVDAFRTLYIIPS
jgi:Tol biopolymer transport system component